MSELTLNGAFKLRNKLKRTIDELDKGIAASDFYYLEGSAENTLKLDGISKREALDRTINLKGHLCALNIAIDKANVANIDLIQNVRSLNIVIMSLKVLQKGIQRIPVTQSVSNESGVGFTTVKTIPTLKAEEIKQRIIDYETAKEQYEDLLSKNNATIKVNFDPSSVAWY